jgi:hypothetical protein
VPAGPVSSFKPELGQRRVDRRPLLPDRLHQLLELLINGLGR